MNVEITVESKLQRTRRMKDDVSLATVSPPPAPFATDGVRASAPPLASRDPTSPAGRVGVGVTRRGCMVVVLLLGLYRLELAHGLRQHLLLVGAEEDPRALLKHLPVGG